jgi:hypothetical protein
MRQQVGLIVRLALACHVAALLLFPSIAVIRGDANNPFLKGTFYAEIALGLPSNKGPCLEWNELKRAGCEAVNDLNKLSVGSVLEL